MKIVFLGTNGWYSTVKTGNTICTLLDTDKSYIILDGGDGIHKLEKYIKDSNKPIYLFVSHTHPEHIWGLHTIDEFKIKQGINIYGIKGIKEDINKFMSLTFSLNSLPYKVKIHELNEGKYKSPLKFECKKLVHPSPCLGYRFEIDKKIITYCTDTGICKNDELLAKDADVLIHECALKYGESTPEWPHTNPEEAAELAKKSNVKKLILTHFDAKRYQSIEKRKTAENQARRIFKNTVAATDDMKIEI